MKETLLKFKKLEIDKATLKKEIGDDLYNVDCPKPIIVNRADVSVVIQNYLKNDIPLEQLVDWVNVVWFTDLFELLESESDSIMSVLEILETLDEEDATVSTKEFLEMLAALSDNKIYKEEK